MEGINHGVHSLTAALIAHPRAARSPDGAGALRKAARPRGALRPLSVEGLRVSLGPASLAGAGRFRPAGTWICFSPADQQGKLTNRPGKQGRGKPTSQKRGRFGRCAPALVSTTPAIHEIPRMVEKKKEGRVLPHVSRSFPARIDRGCSTRNRARWAGAAALDPEDRPTKLVLCFQSLYVKDAGITTVLGSTAASCKTRPKIRPETGRDALENKKNDDPLTCGGALAGAGWCHHQRHRFRDGDNQPSRPDHVRVELRASRNGPRGVPNFAQSRYLFSKKE